MKQHVDGLEASGLGLHGLGSGDALAQFSQDLGVHLSGKLPRRLNLVLLAAFAVKSCRAATEGFGVLSDRARTLDIDSLSISRPLTANGFSHLLPLTAETENCRLCVWMLVSIPTRSLLGKLFLQREPIRAAGETCKHMRAIPDFHGIGVELVEARSWHLRRLKLLSHLQHFQ